LGIIGRLGGKCEGGKAVQGTRVQSTSGAEAGGRGWIVARTALCTQTGFIAPKSRDENRCLCYYEGSGVRVMTGGVVVW